MLNTEFHNIILTDEGRDLVKNSMGKQMTAGESLEHKWIQDLK
jgi:hypothetical protein